MTPVTEHESGSFEQRWADWEARGRERGTRTKRRMGTVAILVLVGIAAAVIRVIARG